MTAAGWWIFAGLGVGGLNVIAFALVSHFDEDPPRPPPKSEPVVHVRRVKDPT